MIATVLAAALAAGTAPRRVVSLNLCTDELALLLAGPGQLASVSRLGTDTDETVLSPRARGLPVNNGRIEPVLRLAPDLILAGGSSAYALEMARRLGIRALDVPPPLSIAGVERNVRAIAAALGHTARGEAVIAEMRAALAGRVPRARTALLVGGGGVSAPANGLAAEWLRAAGLHIEPGAPVTVSLERLLTRPPQVLVLTRYRSAQASLNQSWLAHPALHSLPRTTQVVSIDGRPWTCMGPPVAASVQALRRLNAPVIPAQAGMTR